MKLKGKVLTSVLIFGLVFSMVNLSGSLAYFFDLERSSGNQVEGGKLDLQIDWTETYSNSTGAETFPKGGDYDDLPFGENAVFSTKTTQDYVNNPIVLDNVMPDEWGEATVSLHVDNNPAWVKMEIFLTSSGEGENDCFGDDGEENGELAQYLQMLVWQDDGNNIYESEDERLLFTGTADTLSENVWMDNNNDETDGLQALENCTIYYVGIKWWIPSDAPDNIQTDNITFDIIFSAYQRRHQDTPPTDTGSFDPKFFDVESSIANAIRAGCWGYCETAWAYGGKYAENLWDYVKSSQWGWTNGPLTPRSENYDFDLYAAAGQNDLSKGTLVGTVEIDYNTDTTTVKYEMLPGFTMSEAHLWVGSDPLPTKGKGNKYIAAPGQFGLKQEFDPKATSYTFTVDTSDFDDIYVAAHAVVCTGSWS